MFCLYRYKSVVLYFALGSVMLFSAGLGEKKFDVETGIVVFDIKGFGQLTEDVNISIKGEGSLRFRNWGTDAMIEEDYVEITKGVLKNIHKVKRCEKFENKQRFDVDFGSEKILERPMPKGNFKDYYFKGMIKTGQSSIAGYTCDVWEGEGRKKCLYKGIPLLEENYLLGVYYQKKAREVKLNIKTDPSQCTLPDFPIERFAFFKTNIKTKSIKLPKELSKVIVSISKEMYNTLKTHHISEDEMSEAQKKLILDKLGQNIFKTQKVFLPKFLKVLKEARICLQQVDDVNHANACILEVINMKKQITEDVSNEIDSWDEKNKKKTMDHFDDMISLLESKMKCIRASQNMHDLSNCMKLK